MLMFGREINKPSLMLVGQPPDATEPNTDYVRWLQLQIKAVWECAHLHLKKSAYRQKHTMTRMPGREGMCQEVWFVCIDCSPRRVRVINF